MVVNQAITHSLRMSEEPFEDSPDILDLLLRSRTLINERDTRTSTCENSSELNFSSGQTAEVFGMFVGI